MFSYSWKLVNICASLVHRALKYATIQWLEKFKKKRNTCLLHYFNHPIPLAKMMPMRPSGITANPLISLYNMLSHFTSLAFDIQHQIPTQQHQEYNTITWIFSKKNDILAYCIISITQSHRPVWCLCDPLTPLQTLFFYFTIQYIILPRLPLVSNIKYLLSSTKDIIQ